MQGKKGWCRTHRKFHVIRGAVKGKCSIEFFVGVPHGEPPNQVMPVKPQIELMSVYSYTHSSFGLRLMRGFSIAEGRNL